jgi:hypothetical protein
MQFTTDLDILEIISILLIALAFIQVWVNELPLLLGEELLPFKPFNCDACLSWWLGLVLSLAFQNPIFFILYLCNSIFNRIKL